MSGFRARQAGGRGAFLPALVLCAGLFAPTDACAQGVIDGSEGILDADRMRDLTARLVEHVRSPDPRIADLRFGRAGALCGTVETRNRMGQYTGPRAFVADLSDGFVGRLPEGAERRNPGGIAAYRAMERATALFAANCSQ